MDFIVPDWPVPPHVKAACSTRAGGVSPAPYDSLNLGDHVGDDTAHVAANRRRFEEALGARPVYMNQVHGSRSVELWEGTQHGVTADACFTESRGIACTVMVADCLPVLLCDEAGRAVAAAHAGWRGLAAGVIESAHANLPRGANVMAWLGPCIGPEAFEVGPEVKAAFVDLESNDEGHFRAHAEGKFLADLAGLARSRLRALGVAAVYGNDGSRGWCTASNPSRFFSHRRDRVSGRFAAAIWLG
ncbi:MAG: peptidoglycan editing factor PgeF [Burkholderiales bacterium]|nr:peptidoglycan editing factor PgeF [Burkholderiales bacterium]